jgi:beta-lactamase regulating signal transducer with metallopeptidase domain
MSFLLAPLVQHLWSSTLFLLLLLGVLAVLRRRLTASARFAIALIGILKFAIPASAFAPLVERIRTNSTATIAAPLQFVAGGFPMPVAPQAPAAWPAILAAVWLAVAAALLLRAWLTQHRLVALSVRTATPPQPRELEALARARRHAGIRRSIDLARSALPEAPAVLRVFRPLVVLPARGCDDLSDDELESLLRHECAHVARHDNLTARIESVISALFWFHPLIWIAQRITAVERERACDEAAAASADERDAYLAALTKFCHAAIAPRLPGVSCMATARLKERIEHVMNYPRLKSLAPSARSVAAAAAAALLLFTFATAVGDTPAFAAGGATKNEPYSIRMNITNNGDMLVLHGRISDIAKQEVIAQPSVTLRPGTQASVTYDSGLQVLFDVRPAEEDGYPVDVTIRRGELTLQKSSLVVTPSEPPAEVKYSGAPINLSLRNADLRDVLGRFGQVTRFEMRVADDVRGTVTVNWHNVPWDEAFDSLLKENGLTYRIEGKTIHITRK